MAKDLNVLLSKLNLLDQYELKDLIQEAKEGDLEAISEIAERLRSSSSAVEKLTLARELYEWLVEEGEAFYQAHIAEIDYALNPFLTYREADVKQFLSWCRQGGAVAFGLVVRAMQSDTQLFHRFKSQAAQVYKRLSQQEDDFDEDLQLWQAVLTIDSRSKSNEGAIKDALDDLDSFVDDETDPYIAKQYLEVALRRHQKYQETWDVSMALESLKRLGKKEDFAFYKGLSYLCAAVYPSAYAAFCESNDRRCRLAQAYCLIHGMGTPVDHEAGRAILKDYPEDAFALYLLAVSLFRTNPNPSQMLPEVQELLAESQRLGYRPAEVALYMMKLSCSEHTDFTDLQVLFDKFEEASVRDKDAESYGAYSYMAYMSAIHNVLCSLYEEEGMEDNADSLHSMTDVLTADFRVLTPLAAFARALFQRDLLRHQLQNEWSKAMNGFCQSPQARQYAVENALLQVLMEGEQDTDNILSYLVNMGASDKDVMIWSAALAVARNCHKPSLYAALRRGFQTLFADRMDEPLVKLLLAKFCIDNEGRTDEQVAFIRKVLTETEGVSDSLLTLFRNGLISEMQYQDDFAIRDDHIVMREVGAEVLGHFIGYAFFDYQV